MIIVFLILIYLLDLGTITTSPQAQQTHFGHVNLHVSELIVHVYTTYLSYNYYSVGGIIQFP